ncbi:MAG TPA: hypothetical protein VHA52_00120, partial [Candidatus Babeliaceae bacterium]|nr:hypothetical protein [Candidatus Babeliaceae bacterium]
PNSLETIEHVIDAPTVGSESAKASPMHQKLLDSASNAVQRSGAFAYSRATDRYLYHISEQDRARNLAYARTLPAAYIDLETGVLFDTSGIPTGQAILASDLFTLLDTYDVSVPGSHSETKDGMTVKSRIPDAQGSYLYLVYRGAGVTSAKMV